MTPKGDRLAALAKASKTVRPIRVGDRVRIKKYKTWIAWGDRTPQEFGFVTRRDGGYIYARPRWQKHVLEFYDVELELANFR